MKIQGFVLLAIFLNICRTGYSLAIPQNGSNSSWQRVFGGYLVPRDSEYKQGFTVLVGYFVNADDAWPSNVCSGSIITAEYIVSTAYCLTHEGLTEDSFAISITGLKGTTFPRTLTETVLHESYNSNNLVNNIGLGKVNEPYDFTTGELFPVELPDSSWGKYEFMLTQLTVCGHRDPYTTENLFVFEPTCFFFTPRLRTYCKYIEGIKLEDNEICASSINMKEYSVCLQDYGAGLIYVNRDVADGSPFKFYLYAIASYNKPYAGCAEKPTAFLLVNGFVDWIKLNAGIVD